MPTTSFLVGRASGFGYMVKIYDLQRNATTFPGTEVNDSTTCTATHNQHTARILGNATHLAVILVTQIIMEGT